MVAIDVAILQQCGVAAAVCLGTADLTTPLRGAPTRGVSPLLRLTWRRCVMWCVLVILAVYQMRKPNANHYELLNTVPGATKPDITRSYKMELERLRTSRGRTNGSGDLSNGNGSLSSLEIRALHEQLHLSWTTLTNDSRRDAYHRFGDVSQTGEIDIHGMETMAVILSAAAFQLLSYAVGYLLTTPGRFAQARSLFLMFSVAAFLLELHLRLVNPQMTFGRYLPTSLLAFEKVEILKRIAPTALGCCMLISAFLYSDEITSITRLLHGVLITNQLLKKDIDLLAAALEKTDEDTTRSVPSANEPPETDFPKSDTGDSAVTRRRKRHCGGTPSDGDALDGSSAAKADPSTCPRSAEATPPTAPLAGSEGSSTTDALGGAIPQAGNDVRYMGFRFSELRVLLVIVLGLASYKLLTLQSA